MLSERLFGRNITTTPLDIIEGRIPPGGNVIVFGLIRFLDESETAPDESFFWIDEFHPQSSIYLPMNRIVSTYQLEPVGQPNNGIMVVHHAPQLSLFRGQPPTHVQVRGHIVKSDQEFFVAANRILVI